MAGPDLYYPVTEYLVQAYYSVRMFKPYIFGKVRAFKSICSHGFFNRWFLLIKKLSIQGICLYLDYASYMKILEKKTPLTSHAHNDLWETMAGL